MTTESLDQHIEITPGISGGKPRIAGHRITVENIVIWHERIGKTPDEIASEYDITLADVYAALAYYFDHREVIDQSLEESREFVNSLRQQSSSKLHDYPQPEGDARLSEEAIIVSGQLNTEEQEILEQFERGEFSRVDRAEDEMETARQAARNTFNKTRRVNLRVTERDFNLAHARAREEGIPYQTLLSSVIHKYLSGRLTERR